MCYRVGIRLIFLIVDMFISSVPPVIEATLPDVEITIDQQAILACLVTGFPRPEITWLREEEIFPGDSDRISVYEFETSVLDGSGSGSGVELVGSGLIGSGAITNLIRSETSTLLIYYTV